MSQTQEQVQQADIDVLIVGGSLVGLTLSALLAQQGIKGCLTVEKHSSTAIHPRATVMMPRTMQVFKELGLYDIMLKESLKYYDKHTCAITIESLAGKLLHKWMADVNEGIENVSATRRVFLTQQALEPLLRAKCYELGAELRFSTEMTNFTQDAEGVTATILDHSNGKTQTIRAKYMVACDGFRSTTRSALGLPTNGPGLLSRALTIYFEIIDKEKLARLANAHYSGVIYVFNPKVRCFFRFDRDKKESFLVINSAGPQGTEESRFPADTMTMEKAEDYLRAAIGADDIAFNIHQLTTWEAIADLPSHLRSGRVFLAGDSGHRMPPSGGFGGNTGVQDAHNLGWKLALVLKGQAGSDLLASYEEERWPIAKHTVENALAHYVHRTEPSLAHLIDDFDVKESPVEHLELAYRYASRAILGTGIDGSLTEDPATATAQPGSVAHHVLVQVSDSKEPVPISSFMGKDFVLFISSCEQGQGWAKAIQSIQAADSSLPPVRGVRLDFAKSPTFTERYNVETAGAVLVRPDGFVAWSSRSGAHTDDKAADILNDAMKQILCF